MYNTQEIAQRIKIKTKENGGTIGNMLSELNLGVNIISQLAKGQEMSCLNLAKIADYLCVSVDYLLGRTQDSQNMSNNRINAVDIQGDNVQTIGGSESISRRDKEILQKINSLSLDDYADVISYINSKFRSSI